MMVRATNGVITKLGSINNPRHPQCLEESTPPHECCGRKFLEVRPRLWIKIASLGVMVVVAVDWLRRGLWGDICPLFVAKPRLTVRTSMVFSALSYVYMKVTSVMIK